MIKKVFDSLTRKIFSAQFIYPKNEQENLTCEENQRLEARDIKKNEVGNHSPTSFLILFKITSLQARAITSTSA